MRQIIRTAFSILTVLAALAAPSFAAPPPFLLGGDLSALKINEDAGIVYTDNGKAADCLQIFKQNGWNLVRLRLWVHPSGKDGIVNDLAYDAALARRAKAAGMKVMIDFHYSDSWTDAGNQRKPEAWAGDTFTTPTKLSDDVFQYTSNAVYALAHTYHVAPDYVEIGNEVTYGMLWPDGSLNDGGHGGWANWTSFATLLNAGIAGAQRGARKASVPAPETVIHISLGKYWGVVDGFFSGLAAARDVAGRPVSFDVIGLSYYPDDKTDLSDIKETLSKCAAKYHKPILIAETAYSYNHVAAGNGKYPETPQGQADYLSDLVSAVRDTPGGLGVCYWEPEAVPNSISRAFGPGSWRDSGWQALFDTETHAAEPAIKQAARRLRRSKN